MSECQKCGGVMKGPRYCTGRKFDCRHDDVFNRQRLDHLVWTCETCGYVATTPTNDTPDASREAP